MGAQRRKKGRRITPGTQSTHSTYTKFLKKKEEHPISRATTNLWIFDIWSRRGEKVQNNNTAAKDSTDGVVNKLQNKS
jgi:hypothetical protein